MIGLFIVLAFVLGWALGFAFFLTERRIRKQWQAEYDLLDRASARMYRDLLEITDCYEQLAALYKELRSEIDDADWWKDR